MDTELKVMLPVNIADEHEECPPVYIRHTVEFTMHNYLQQRREVRMSCPFHVCDVDHDLEARIVWRDESPTESMYTFYVYVLCSHEDQNKINGKLCFTIKLCDGLIACTKECSINKNTLEQYGWGTQVCFSKVTMYGRHYPKDSFSAAEVAEILRNKSLTIVADIYLQTKGNIRKLAHQALSSQIVKDFGDLLASKDFSDITLKVGNKEMKAHKAILSARSPVFSRMFKSNMAEAKLNTVEIKDMTFEVLQSLVNYIYTDRVDNIDTVAEDVLAVADKYQLDDLMMKCEDALSKGLTVENAARILILADLHEADHLRLDATNFIRRHKQEVMATAEWEAAKTDHPNTIIDLLTKLC